MTSKEKHYKFNIGGKTFELSGSTARSISPYFARLISDDFTDPIKDKDGNIFIDKPSTGFQNIINWVRLGREVVVFKQILITMQKQCTSLEYLLFIKTIDYFGIDHDSLIISPGEEIKIYWRGDKKEYTATIISFPEDLPRIRVRYKTDGECWDYDYLELKHKMGPYKHRTADPETINLYGRPKYWHYGPHSGSKKIKDNYPKLGESKENDDSSDDEESEMETVD